MGGGDWWTFCSMRPPSAAWSIRAVRPVAQEKPATVLVIHTVPLFSRGEGQKERRIFGFALEGRAGELLTAQRRRAGTSARCSSEFASWSL